jgi:Ca2+:H+ antiporter
MKRLLTADNLLILLLIFVPAAAVLRYFYDTGPIWLFMTSALAIVPLAGLMGKATEFLADRLGAGLGGLLNATFGNAAELIIAILALRAGLQDLVKASITGSIIGNVLLVFGLSVLAGGVRHPVQFFNKTAANLASTMLVLSSVSLIVPAIFHMVARAVPAVERELSLEISIVLIITYALSLVFSLKTHRHLYVGRHSAGDHGPSNGPSWSTTLCVSVLTASTALVALMSEFLVGATENAARALGMSQVFVGVILVAIIGNAAEHSTAVLAALKNKMDLAIHVAVGSSIQVALFVAPVLVFLSYFVGPTSMNLHFTIFEVLSVVLAVGIMAVVSQDGESNWMEGVQLLAVYFILGIAFYFLPE